MELAVNMSIFDTDKTGGTGYLNETAASANELSWSEAIEEFIYTKLILAVSVFGIGGNLLNLIILSQKSLTYMMERMEKSAHYGLSVSVVAVSDLLVCKPETEFFQPPSVTKSETEFTHLTTRYRLIAFTVPTSSLSAGNRILPAVVGRRLYHQTGNRIQTHYVTLRSDRPRSFRHVFLSRHSAARFLRHR